MTYEEISDNRWPLLAQAKRPARYGAVEWGAGHPKPHTPDMVRYCLAFPDVYEVGMSYLGYQIFYALLLSMQKADAERVYTPWPDMEAIMRNSGAVLGSLESGRPLCDFDVVAVTLQYELSYTNVLTMLDLGKIPLMAHQRQDECPLVIAGGPGAMVAEPMRDFVDAFAIGDGEVLFPDITDCLSGLKGRPRGEKLAALAEIGGMYVPSFAPKSPVRRRIVQNLDDSFIPDNMIVPSTSIVHDRVSVQVFRGCTRGCRFCQAGMIDRPVRSRSAQSVCNQAKSILENTGWEELGFLSLATCDWPGLDTAIETLSPYLKERNIKLSLPSLRVDAFSVELASRLDSVRRGGLTFAPEAGSARMRQVINKGVTDEHIHSALDAAFSNGWDRIKLYFMMGLPTETQEDLDGIVSICNGAMAIGRSHKRKVNMNVSLAGFVPKAHTPFQWEQQASMEELKNRGRYVKSKIKDKFIQLSYHAPEQTFLEGVFSRGDSALGAVILDAWRRGARFDGWTETFALSRWLEAFEACSVNPENYTAARDVDAPMPWDHIDTGVSKKFLLSERAMAHAATQTADCRESGCTACGCASYGCATGGAGNAKD